MRIKKHYQSTKLFKGFSCCFRQWKAEGTHCRFIHGYAIEFKVTFECDSLDNRNWVFDFGNTAAMKDTLAHLFDHTLVVAADDPKLYGFREMEEEGIIQMRVLPEVSCEKFAEAVAILLGPIVRKMTSDRVRIKKVKCIENKNNSATYIL